MLVSGKCLSAEQVEVIEDFVKNGGTVLLDGESSLYDKNGRRLQDFQLGSAMNLKWHASGVKTTSFFVRDVLSYIQAGEVHGEFEMVRTNPIRQPKSMEIASTKNGTVILKETPSGDGRYLYSAIPWGGVLFHSYPRETETYVAKSNPALEKLFVQWVNYALGENRQSYPINVPANVPYYLYDTLEDGKRKLAICFLNCTAWNLRDGQKPAINKEYQFPSIREDVRIAVRAKVKNGFVVSHDFEGKRSIQIRELPDNFREIVLSKKDLKMHAIVYLDCE
jgi:hypothetical protein